MEKLIFTLCSNIIILILFINLGLYFRKLLFKDSDDIIEFKSIDLILGISISIFLLFFLSKIIGFKNASFTVFVVMLLNRYNLNILRIKFRYIYLILTYFLFLLLNFQYDGNSNLDRLDPMVTFNLVAHSVRAANLSIFINNNDFIPAINQNIFQSIVASFINNFSTKGSIQFNFSVIMAAMPIATFFMLSLIFKYASFKKHRLIAFLCMFINPAFSTHLITFNDGGSSLFNTRSFDIYFSICCFLLLIYFMKNLKSLVKVNFIILSFVLISLYCSMLFAGPQFIVFISCFAFLLVVFSFYKDGNIPYKNFTLLTLSCLLFSGIVSMSNGGFFILEGFRDLYAIPGIGGLWDDVIHAHRRIGLRTPYFLCYAEYGSHLWNHLLGNPTRILPWPQNELQYGLHKLSITETIFYSFCTIRFISVPVISLIISYFLLKKINLLNNHTSVFYSFCFSALIFTFLYLFIEMQMYIWPLSRFLHPLLIACILSTGFVLNYIFTLELKDKLFLLSVILFLTFPGFIQFSNQIQTSGLCDFSNFKLQFTQTEMISLK